MTPDPTAEAIIAEMRRVPCLSAPADQARLHPGSGSNL
jgi:hypothetical protein